MSGFMVISLSTASSPAARAQSTARSASYSCTKPYTSPARKASPAAGGVAHFTYRTQRPVEAVALCVGKITPSFTERDGDTFRASLKQNIDGRFYGALSESVSIPASMASSMRLGFRP